MQSKQQAVEFMEMYQDEILESHRLEKERECKINSVFGLMDTRQIIFKHQKQILEDERTKTEEGLIDQYFKLKCEDEIERVKGVFTSVIRGKYLISGGRDYFIKNFTGVLKEDSGLTLTDEFFYGEVKHLETSLGVDKLLQATLPTILKKNKDYVRGAIYKTVKKFTVECQKYFEIMEQRKLKKNNGEQYIIEHEGVTYKLFNRAGNRINMKINNNFLDHYIEDGSSTIEAGKKLLRGLRKYKHQYM
tara:strand:- start:48 stop:788 length:741 start_codon:yes stop_codon:yes gene_type:complete